MVDSERVIRLLDRIRRDRMALASTGASPSDVELDAAKYRFITMIEGAAHVAHHISVSEGWSSPDPNAEAFGVIAGKGVIDDSLADDLAKAAGFRNVLVHQYADVDDRLVIANLTKLSDFDAFIEQVGRWIGAHDPTTQG